MKNSSMRISIAALDGKNPMKNDCLTCEPMRTMCSYADKCDEQIWIFCGTHAQPSHLCFYYTIYSPIVSRRGLTASKTNLRTVDEAPDDDDVGDG